MPSETLPLLPSQMTDETIGDPPASSGRPSGPRHGHTGRHDQKWWPPPRSPAGSGPADQACSFAASGQNLPPPQTASQEQDRKMTGSFTRPTGRTSSQRSRQPSRLPQPLLQLGDRDEARRLAAEELELARTWGAPRALGAALRAAGLAEGGARGLELLEEAVEVLTNSPAKLEHAKARTELGAALRRANRRSEARAAAPCGRAGNDLRRPATGGTRQQRASRHRGAAAARRP